jgi:hypothetical protein
MFSTCHASVASAACKREVVDQETVADSQVDADECEGRGLAVLEDVGDADAAREHWIFAKGFDQIGCHSVQTRSDTRLNQHFWPIA